jgi:tetratricopeptide (TPR) repeat protein
MDRVVLVVLVIGLLVVTDVRSRAVGPDESSIESSNQVSLAQSRRTASEQQTNAVAWLNYGRAALKELTAQMEKTGELPGTNAYDEALDDLGRGLQLDATNYKLHSEIATVYERRAIRKPSEDDQTTRVDLERALDHCSLALSNAPLPWERVLIERKATTIRQRIDTEREREQSIEAFKKASPFEKREQLAAGAKLTFASEANQRRLAEARTRAQQEPENTGAVLNYAERLITVEFVGLGHTNVFSEARAVLQKAIGLDAHNARAYELMGLCVDMQGEQANALVYYRQALKEDPNSQSIRDRIQAIEGRVSYILQLEHPAESPGQP